MTDPSEQLTAWNQAAYDAAMNYARASLASAEELLRLNLDTARATLEQASRATRDLMSVTDPQQFVQTRAKLAQDNMQQAAAYAQSVYAIVSQAQRDMTKLWEEQMSRFSKDVAAGAAGKGAGLQSPALDSTLAASSAVMDSLNQAARQFAELSEATMKAAAAQMVKGLGKN